MLTENNSLGNSMTSCRLVVADLMGFKGDLACFVPVLVTGFIVEA